MHRVRPPRQTAAPIPETVQGRRGRAPLAPTADGSCALVVVALAAPLVDDGLEFFAVVGVVADNRHNSLSRPGTAEAYFPFEQTPQTRFSLVMPGPANSRDATRALRTAMNSVDPTQAFSAVVPTADYVQLPANLLDGLTNVTIEAWIRPISFQTWARAFDF